jgi:hypothetical protein
MRKQSLLQQNAQCAVTHTARHVQSYWPMQAASPGRRSVTRWVREWSRKARAFCRTPELMREGARVLAECGSEVAPRLLAEAERWEAELAERKPRARRKEARRRSKPRKAR